MRAKNPVIERQQAQALKAAQSLRKRVLSTPAQVSRLCDEELELLQENEVELRHHLSLSLSPRRRQLRIRRSQDRRIQRTNTLS